jgi:hypothetical protein
MRCLWCRLRTRMLDIVLCPSLPDVAASRAEHLFESEDAIESLAQVLEAFRDAEKRGLPGWEPEQQSGLIPWRSCPMMKVNEVDSEERGRRPGWSVWFVIGLARSGIPLGWLWQDKGVGAGGDGRAEHQDGRESQ